MQDFVHQQSLLGLVDPSQGSIKLWQGSFHFRVSFQVPDPRVPFQGDPIIEPHTVHDTNPALPITKNIPQNYGIHPNSQSLGSFK